MTHRLVKEIVHAASGSTPGVGDPRREAVRRLRLLSTAAAIGPAIGLVFMLTLAPEGSAIAVARTTTIGVILSEIALSLGLRWLLGKETISLERRLPPGPTGACPQRSTRSSSLACERIRRTARRAWRRFGPRW